MEPLDIETVASGPDFSDVSRAFIAVSRRLFFLPRFASLCAFLPFANRSSPPPAAAQLTAAVSAYAASVAAEVRDGRAVSDVSALVAQEAAA